MRTRGKDGEGWSVSILHLGGRALYIGATTIDLGRRFECLLSLAAFEVKGRSVFATDYTVWHSIILGLLFR